MPAPIAATRRRSFEDESPGLRSAKLRQSPEPEEQHSTFANLAHGYPSRAAGLGSTAHQSRQTSGQTKHRPQPAQHSSSYGSDSEQQYNRLEAGPGTPVPLSPKSPALTGVSPPHSPSTASGPGPGGHRSSGPLGASRGIVGRTIKRGNLPFMIAFVACLFVFFSALSGRGYVDPAAAKNAHRNSLDVGSAAFIPYNALDRDLKLMEKQREWERTAGKRVRPQDGLWMKKHRDDKAIRRDPATARATATGVAHDLDDFESIFDAGIGA